MQLSGRRVLVMGLGRSGQAAARLAASRGAVVTGIDLRSDVPAIDGVDLVLGPHPQSCFDDADLIVVSPGVPLTQPQLARGMATGTAVMGELSFAASLLDAPMVGVTGTNGKSTVTWFTGQLLDHAGMRPFVGGNLGNPLSNAAMRPQDHATLVVEVSSYQLELAGGLRPDIGVILNLTPDHLVRHGTMGAYAAAKARLFERMTPSQLAVLPTDGQQLAHAARESRGTRLWIGQAPGVVRRDRDVVLDLPGASVRRLSLDAFTVPGSHNLDNAATAALLAVAMGADIEAVREGISRLVALPHRMEVVSERDGVRWINDSKATNVDAARAGIRGLDATAVVLLGGQGKSTPDGGFGFGRMADDLRRHRGIVAFGEAGPTIAAELRAAGVSCFLVNTLAEAVAKAASKARSGDSVLLSPGCASFDAFDDFEHRGRQFAVLARGELP